MGALTFIIMVLVGSLEWKYRWIFRHEFVSRWEDQSAARVPASGLAEKLEGHLNEKVLADFFTPNDFAKIVSYEVRPRFWTDQNEEYLEKKFRQTVDESIVSTLREKESAGNEPVLSSLIKKNVSEAFVRNFVKTIQVHNLVNATFQFDLFFTPRMEKNIHFRKELASNQLINLDDNGQLYQMIAPSENEVEGQVATILRTQVPFDGERQFVGGSMTLWFKVLDTAWNPLRPIPNPKKNAVKGFLRYRKYIRVNRKVSITSQKGLVDMIHIAPMLENTPIYYTLDIIKTFNLGDLTPKLARLEIYPGALEPNNVHKGSVLHRLFSRGEETIETAHYNAHGKVNGSPFTARLEKLVYDFEDKKWLWDSHININLRQNFDHSEEMLSHSQIKREILTESPRLFIQSLGLAPYLTLEGAP